MHRSDVEAVPTVLASRRTRPVGHSALPTYPLRPLPKLANFWDVPLTISCGQFFQYEHNKCLLGSATNVWDIRRAKTSPLYTTVLTMHDSPRAVHSSAGTECSRPFPIPDTHKIHLGDIRARAVVSVGTGVGAWAFQV